MSLYVLLPPFAATLAAAFASSLLLRRAVYLNFTITARQFILFVHFLFQLIGIDWDLGRIECFQ